jgi:hypothetical protein
MLVWVGLSALATVAAYASVTTDAAAYQTVEVTDGGTITGSVRYVGEPPAPKTIAVTKDPEVCGREKTATDLLVSPEKGIRNVVVRLSDVAQGKAFAKRRTVTVRQKGCEYSPRVSLFPAGTRVRIENADGILHHTNTQSEANPSFTVAQPGYRRVMEKRIDEPEMPIRIRCDVHAWMGAWWISQEHPYYALSDAKGAFTLADVPPGAYTLEAWHESLGRVSRKVTVAPKTTLEVTLEMTRH